MEAYAVVRPNEQATGAMAGDSVGRVESEHEKQNDSTIDETSVNVCRNSYVNSKAQAEPSVEEASVQDDLGGIGNEEDFLNDEYGQELERNNTGVRIRKPYTLTRARKTWTNEEHKCFLEALSRCVVLNGMGCA